MSKARKRHASRARKAEPAAAPDDRNPDRVVIALAIAGMLITAYLTASAWLDAAPALCTQGTGCDVIRQSRWSTVLGVPVALWGFALYLLVGLFAWRMPDRLKRWRRLWTLSLLGVAISVYLTMVGVVQLDAVCAWCLASLVTVGAIMARVAMHRHKSAPGMSWPIWLAQTGGTAVVAVTLLHLWYGGLFAHPDTPRLIALAEQLEESGAQFYGAWWCPACQRQKDAFRGAANRLPYVECSSGGRGSPMTLRCQSVGIVDFPTWIIDGRHYAGVLSPRELARHVDMPWE